MPTVAISLIVAILLCALANAEAPLVLGGGPHLFLDEHLIAEQSNLTRMINHPTKLPEPVVTGPEDKCFQPYLTVLRDPDSGRFRIWYGVPENAGQSHLGYMESDDGVRWRRPHRVLDDPGPIQFGVSIRDEGKAYPDPAIRYKYGYWWGGGLCVAGSPDGFVWKPLADGPVLKHNHDINSIFRDPIRNRYIAFVSSYTEGPTWTGQRRIPMESVSDDLIHWRDPWFIFAPDAQDEGETQFYCMDGVIARGDLLIGLLKVLRDDLPADPDGPKAGIGYTVLAWSRDGEHWTRDREPFMGRGPAGRWDHAMTWGDEQLIVGDETFIYYGGYKQGHKIERFAERQIGLARMPRDRYVARKAGETRGLLRTPLLSFAGDRLTVNADVRGYLRVRLLDASGKAIPGFDWDDCGTVIGDSVEHDVKWRGERPSVQGKTVRIEFALKDAELYGFAPEV
ncbi:MAG: hypothetical protein FJX75_07585 [Armatimonadetes bacterium]|nr:hypothetical protein [Armatimonadota bacterium]